MRSELPLTHRKLVVQPLAACAAQVVSERIGTDVSRKPRTTSS